MHYRSAHKQHTTTTAIKRLGITSILIAFAYVSIETIWSLFIYSMFPNASTVGFVMGILAVALFLYLAFLFPLFNKFSARSILFFAVSANAIVFALFAFTTNPAVFFILALINGGFTALRIQSIGIILRNNSSLKRIAKDENILYLLANVGWLIGPIIAGFVADKLSIQSVLILASLFMLLSVYTVTFSQKAFGRRKAKEMQHINVFKNLWLFFRSKKRIISYILSSGVEIWWTVPYIFIPIEMVEKQGMSYGNVGLFLFFLVIPLIIVEYIMRKKERTQLRKIMGLGYLIAAICGIVAACSPGIIILLFALVIGSFGMGLLEPSVDGYFFRINKQEESQRFYGSFMTSKMAGSLFSKFVIASVLLFFSLRVAIGVVSVCMIGMAFLSIKEKKKRRHH